jgi:uncharacterized protein YjbI with pentapeptide repeats
MKRLTILITMLMATSCWAYIEKDLLKFKATNVCINCDLSGANFSGLNLRSADFTGANLKGSTFVGADMRWADSY